MNASLQHRPRTQQARQAARSSFVGSVIVPAPPRPPWTPLACARTVQALSVSTWLPAMDVQPASSAAAPGSKVLITAPSLCTRHRLGKRNNLEPVLYTSAPAAQYSSLVRRNTASHGMRHSPPDSCTTTPAPAPTCIFSREVSLPRPLCRACACTPGGGIRPQPANAYANNLPPLSPRAPSICWASNSNP
jgi:hypothetical protein